MTGLTNFIPGLRQKYVELLKEVVQTASGFGVIGTAGALSLESMRDFEVAAKKLGLTRHAVFGSGFRS
jgi:hypothetical protein